MANISFLRHLSRAMKLHLVLSLSATMDPLIDKPRLKPDTPTKLGPRHWCERLMITHINTPWAKLLGLNLE